MIRKKVMDSLRGQTADPIRDSGKTASKTEEGFTKARKGKKEAEFGRTGRRSNGSSDL